MLIDNEKHQKYHSSGPIDCYFGRRGKAVMTVQITRSTVSNEQMTIGVPIFCDDTREDMDLRIGMALSITQERMEDANAAWLETNKKAKEE